MHADLKREPRTKPEVPGEGVESVTAQVWVKPPKEKRIWGGGGRKTTENPFPFLPPSRQQMEMMKLTVIIMCHVHRESGRPCSIEGAKGTRRKTMM